MRFILFSRPGSDGQICVEPSVQHLRIEGYTDPQSHMENDCPPNSFEKFWKKVSNVCGQYKQALFRYGVFI